MGPADPRCVKCQGVECYAQCAAQCIMFCTVSRYRNSRLLRHLAFPLLVAASSCAREPTDPSRSDLTGFWQSVEQVRYISNMEMELTQTEPGIVIGKWRAFGKVDNSCPPGQFCRDSSIIQGRTEVAQVVLHAFGAGDFVGEQASTNVLKGAIRSFEQNYHVTFIRK